MAGGNQMHSKWEVSSNTGYARTSISVCEVNVQDKSVGSKVLSLGVVHIRSVIGAYVQRNP